jgi:uncharacterized protein YyaL (SSP411 family)
MAAWGLLRLGYLLGKAEWEELGRETLERMSEFAGQYPSAAGQMLIATDFHLGPVEEIVLVEGESQEENGEVRKLLQNSFRPNSFILIRTNGAEDADLPQRLQKWYRGKSGRGGKPTAYFCRGGSCGLPAVGIPEIRAKLSASQ